MRRESSVVIQRVLLGLAMILGVPRECPAASSASEPPRIIDMHLHALHAADQGPPPVAICAPYPYWPTRDPRWSPEELATQFFKHPPCKQPLWSAQSDEELMTATLKVLERRNIVGVTSGPADLVAQWKKAAPTRIIPGLLFGLKDAPKLDDLRRMIKSGEVAVIGEILNQYQGVAQDDKAFEPYLALAEELDVPIGIHMGPGPPGTPYLDPSMQAYRAMASSPLQLEDVLVRHPKLRLYVMHAGWPMGDDMIAMLYTHPQLYVDLGVIDYVLPRAEFYRYLRLLIDAGFEQRIMFGSDQMVWPQAIEKSIDAIGSAPFLSDRQKREILHDNAARFLRLETETGIR